ncbi:TonB-dependent receptor [Shewanella sp. D64]|uniref:TonB-dependent receptor plug domain-containing protein n=1 Tax=unclassified Shewanella TaxID=196818 RepID=UPI0022BA495A|nr:MULTISPECIES: TonB-dependent receptor [unclassified Shewanella]MEC4725268.1 TonB-dependent receptor [Shewanella sp. D64]MEC4735886.1 TonB-dependent receptor [Shewanella sp. E94]WBJ93145.1 TonB-dependent receptor [Shewanella sp. MTB7]
MAITARYSRSKLTTAIKLGLIASVSSTGIMVSTSVSAQEEAKVERIQVTGSRIQRTDMETSSPVTVISRAEIDASGVATVSDFVRNMSQNSFGSFRDASGFGSGQSSQSTVSMRGLGPQRTLVLIDGRRMGSSVAFGGGTQNLNVVPMAAVERIEVLRDGASAVYGSDAVAGVINIITKNEYEGVEIDAEQGITQHGGGESTNIRMTFGVVGEKTNIVASVEYFNRSPLYDADRDFSDTLYSGYGWPGSGSYTDYNKPLFDDEGNAAGFESVSFADERCEENPNSIIDGGKCKYNAASESATMASQERLSSFLKVDHELTDDIRWSNRLMLTKVWTEGQYAAAPNSNSPTLKYTEANAAIYEATVKKYGNKYLNDQLMYENGEFIGVNPDAKGNGEIALSMRTTPLGPRVTKVEDTDINFLTSLNGYADIFGGATWDVGAQWIRSDVSTVQTGTANAAIIQDMLDSGDLDYFAAGAGYEVGSNEEMMQQAGHTAVFTGRVQTYGVDASISLDLFDLPAGAVPLALGVEWNRTEYDKMSDAASNLGNIVGSSGGDIIQGKSREVFSLSAETLLPIIEDLDMELSARVDDYSDFGTTFNPKVGFSYRPVDSLLVRSSWGTGFRAPTFDDMYANASETFLWAEDKVGCKNGVAECGRAQYKAQYQGNEQLEAEESTSLSVGIVWNATDALDFELSYYDIEIDNVITTMHSQDVFDMELAGLDVSDILIRNPDTGKVDHIVLKNMNLGKMSTSGIDFNANYLLETGIGEFRFGAETNYVLTWEEKAGPDAPMEDVVGELGSPQYRINLNTTWTQGEWDASLFARYTASQEETYLNSDKETLLTKTAAQWILDLQVGYNLNWDAKVNVGVRNLLDEEPPLNDYLGFPGYDSGLYDPIGREFYIRYNQKL